MREISKIVLTLKEDGSMEISAPLHDKLLCYGMLALANDLVRDHKPKLIIPPTGRTS